eukprot:SAG22_NODE_2974_length_2057_cov_1.829928_3_plen_34_part_01
MSRRLALVVLTCRALRLAPGRNNGKKLTAVRGPL